VPLRHRRVDGGWVWFEVTNHNRLADPACGDVLADMIDVSEEMAAQEEVKAHESLLHRLAETLPIGVFQVGPDRRIVYQNERLGTMLGAQPVVSLEEQLATLTADDRISLEAALAGCSSRLTTG